VLCCAAASDLLGDPRRFVVMSIESKLLVLLPTLSGQMVAICVKDVTNSEKLTNDVVKTIMAVRNVCICSVEAAISGNTHGCWLSRGISCLSNSTGKFSVWTSL
jgi:hypothetical protein